MEKLTGEVQMDGFLETAEPGLSGLTIVGNKRKRSYKHPMIPTPKPSYKDAGSDWRYDKNAEGITEDDIRLEAYFIWERSGKVKLADECWMEAKEKLGIE